MYRLERFSKSVVYINPFWNALFWLFSLTENKKNKINYKLLLTVKPIFIFVKFVYLLYKMALVALV